MNAIAPALLPVMLLIALGLLLRKSGLVADVAWAGLEKVAYYVFFPALLINNLGGQSLGGVPWLPMLLVILGTCVVAAVALILWFIVSRSVSGATFTSIFQGGVRFNSYIALAVCEAFYGTEGLAVGAIGISFMIVIVNLMSVAAFAIWGSRGAVGARSLFRDIAANPLIVACTIGLVLSATGVGLPPLAADTFGLIGRAALPVGLLAVGAGVQLRAMRGHVRPVVVSTLVQYGLKPLTAVSLMSVAGLSGAAAATIVIIFVTPAAASSYILAKQLGGDTSAVASIITLQTLLAFVVTPTALALLL